MLTEQKINNVKEEINRQNCGVMDVEDAIKVLCTKKDEFKLSWEDIAALSSMLFGTTQKEKYFRDNFGEYAKSAAINNEIENKILQLKKERVKLSDERTQTGAYIRRLAREDTIKEIAQDFAEKMNGKKLLDMPLTIQNNPKENDAILCLSDWHFGIEINNHANVYNPEVTKKRVSQLRDEVINKCTLHDVETIHILNLADLIAGRIHLTLRLESRFDVITQIMEVSEILAELITDLSRSFKIEYHSCLDNHSRLEPNKKDSLDLESLCRIADWYLASRLKDNKNFKVADSNEYGEDIISFTCRGHLIAGAHGHYDKASTAVFKLNSYTHNDYDLICLSHRHHFAAEEECRSLLICNGSIMGTDSYAHQLRLDSKPSQNLIITSEHRVMEALYRIELD